jgi:hypothetical protein
MRRDGLMVGVLGLSLSAGAVAAPPRYHVTVIPPPPGSDFQPGPRAINDLGWAAGNWGNYGTFLYKPGEGTISIGTPPGQPFMAPKDINNRGEIVGASASELIKLGTEAQVFRWKDGVFQMYPQLVPGRVANVGLMNDLGRVVGDANDGSFIGYKALEYTADGQITLLFPDTFTYDHAIDINNAGQILGTEVRGIFRWRWPEEPEPSFLPPLPGWIVEVQAMNDLGDVVGISRITGHSETRTAALYTDDGGWSFLPRNGRRAIPTSINSAREVVGNTRDGSIIGDHGWRWTAEDGLIPLNELIEPLGAYRVWIASDINEHGQIAASGEEQATGRSVGMILTPIPGTCAADLTGDGLVDFADYLDFLNLYDAGDPRVDYNQDGLVDFVDYLEFLNLYELGC